MSYFSKRQYLGRYILFKATLPNSYLAELWSQEVTKFYGQKIYLKLWKATISHS